MKNTGIKLSMLSIALLSGLSALLAEPVISIFKAIQRTDNLGVLRAYITAGIDVNAVNEDGRTILMEAASRGFGYTKWIRLLLGVPGIEINAVNRRGWTALMVAASHAYGNTECVRLLLGAPGIEINAVNKYGWTALMLAASNAYGDTECIRLLLGAPGIALNAVEKQGGRTALMLAAKSGRTDCVNELLVAGARPDVVDNKGLTALMVLIQSEDPYDRQRVAIARALLYPRERSAQVAQENCQSARADFRFSEPRPVNEQFNPNLVLTRGGRYALLGQAGSGA